LPRCPRQPSGPSARCSVWPWRSRRESVTAASFAAEAAFTQLKVSSVSSSIFFYSSLCGVPPARRHRARRRSRQSGISPPATHSIPGRSSRRQGPEGRGSKARIQLQRALPHSPAGVGFNSPMGQGSGSGRGFRHPQALPPFRQGPNRMAEPIASVMAAPGGPRFCSNRRLSGLRPMIVAELIGPELAMWIRRGHG